jgi:hypothetical protein
MKNIGKRLYDLLIKMISVKGSVFVIASVLMFQNKIDAITWGFFAAGFVGLRTLEKFIQLKKGE